MSKPGLYVMVGMRGCRGKGPTGRWLGCVVHVAGDSLHGPCCATVMEVGHPGFEARLLEVRGPEALECFRQYGIATPWANLRPLEDPDQERVEEREEVTA